MELSHWAVELTDPGIMGRSAGPDRLRRKFFSTFFGDFEGVEHWEPSFAFFPLLIMESKQFLSAIRSQSSSIPLLPFPFPEFQLLH